MYFYLHFLKIISTAFYKTFLHSYQQWTMIPFSYILSYTCYTFVVVIAILINMKWYLMMIVRLISLTEDNEHVTCIYRYKRILFIFFKKVNLFMTRISLRTWCFTKEIVWYHTKEIQKDKKVRKCYTKINCMIPVIWDGIFRTVKHREANRVMVAWGLVELKRNVDLWFKVCNLT